MRRIEAKHFDTSTPMPLMLPQRMRQYQMITHITNTSGEKVPVGVYTCTEEQSSSFNGSNKIVTHTLSVESPSALQLNKMISGTPKQIQGNKLLIKKDHMSTPNNISQLSDKSTRVNMEHNPGVPFNSPQLCSKTLTNNNVTQSGNLLQPQNDISGVHQVPRSMNPLMNNFVRCYNDNLPSQGNHPDKYYEGMTMPLPMANGWSPVQKALIELNNQYCSALYGTESLRRSEPMRGHLGFPIGYKKQMPTIDASTQTMKDASCQTNASVLAARVARNPRTYRRQRNTSSNIINSDKIINYYKKSNL